MNVACKNWDIFMLTCAMKKCNIPQETVLHGGRK